MNEQERIIYLQQYLHEEIGRIGIDHIIFQGEAEWFIEMLCNDDADPTGAHKWSGFSSIQHVGDKFALLVCPELAVRPVADIDEEEFQLWCMFWTLHLSMHLIIRNAHFAEYRRFPPLDVEEALVEERMRDNELTRGISELADRYRQYRTTTG